MASRRSMEGEARQAKKFWKEFFELVREHGRSWTTIAKKMEEKEGRIYRADDGKPFTANALRKKFDNYLKYHPELYREAQELGLTTDAKPQARPRTVSPPAPPESTTAVLPEDSTVSAREVLTLLKGSVERRDAMLAEKIRHENIPQYDPSMMTDMQDRLEAKLIESVQRTVEDVVGRRIDEALSAILSPGGAFEEHLTNRINAVIDQRLSGEVGSMLDFLSSSSAGAERGAGAEKMARFSATMPRHLYDAMKAIDDDSSFSSRLAAACELFLRVREAQADNTAQTE